MTQITVKPGSASSSSNEAPGAPPPVPATGFQSADGYTVSGQVGDSATAADPYAGVNWEKVDYSGVNWSDINYDVVPQTQQATGSTPNTTANNSTSEPGNAAPLTDVASDTSGGSGPGIYLTNASNVPQTYSFYRNSANGDGWANPTYTDPLVTVTLQPGESKFVALPAEFKGRVQRTNGDASANTFGGASTWAEFQLSAANDGGAHGDVSLQTGFDGAATIASTDGSNQVGGFTQDLLADAPSDILATSATGERAIANNTDQAATAYLQAHVDESQAYTGTAASGTNDVASKNNQLAITFY